MAATDAQLQSFHRKNYKQVNSAVKQIARSVRSAIARNDEAASSHLKNVLLMMVAVKSEARILQILYIPNGFTESQRRIVLGERTLYDKWQKTVEMAFRSNYGISRNSEIQDHLVHSNVARLNSIHDFIANDLHDLIHIRNKLAHGQWFYPMNDRMTEVSTDLKRFAATETVQTITLRNKELDAIGNIISDLVQSRRLFESRFDTHYARVQKAQKQLKNANFKEWKSDIRARHLRGIGHINNNTSGRT